MFLLLVVIRLAMAIPLAIAILWVNVMGFLTSTEVAISLAFALVMEKRRERQI
jgi:hypothetical protein